VFPSLPALISARRPCALAPTARPPPAPLCRLVTPAALQRKRARKSLKKRQQEKNKTDAAEYHKLLMQRLKEQRERR
jgi:hypothetical protein